MNPPADVTYRPDLAMVHHRGFGAHAAACAPGIVDFLAPVRANSGPDWAVITKFSVPAPDRFVRDITTFLPNPDGSWRRETEHHENVLIDTAQIPALLRARGVQASVGTSFGSEANPPPGLRVVTGHRLP